MAWNYISFELVIPVVILLVVYLFKRYWNNDRIGKYPPGPYSMPLIGNFLVFLDNPHLKLNEMSKTYGEIVSVKIGPLQTVVLNSAKAIREAFSKPEMLGRPDDIASDLISTKVPIFANGKLWLEHRRFIMRAFRDLGLGKLRMHELIMEEIQFILKRFEEEKGNVCDIRNILTPSMANNICSMIFGERYDYDDPERIFIDSRMKEQERLIKYASVQAFFPWLKNIPFVSKLLKTHEFRKISDELKQLVLRKIEDRKKVLDEHNLRDLIDIYLNEMNDRKVRDPETTLAEDCLPGLVLGLFSPGADTVRSSVEWALYTMAAYPDVQNEVHEELDKVVGSERTPSVDDAKNLPFIQSLLAEMQRWQTVAAIGPMRQTLNDVEVLGYNIPKGTLIVANFWAAHNDPTFWKNPSMFNPRRFLTNDGKFLIKHDNYLPFSIGKRACPGEGLALTETFLYFTSILQKFRLNLPKGEEPNFDGKLTIIYQPVKHELVFTLRK